MATAEKFDRYTLQFKNGHWNVYGWGTYKRSSVLAGQPMKVWQGSYETREEAQAACPQATGGSDFTDLQVCLSHLPGEDDPVAGGMYPDDYTDTNYREGEEW